MDKTSGQILAEKTKGANLVNGKETWEYADTHKHDLETMKACCEAELRTMALANVIPAPFYFERVAIIAKKQKDLRTEKQYCEKYIKVIDDFYKKNSLEVFADVRKGATYQRILKRLANIETD